MNIRRSLLALALSVGALFAQQGTPTKSFTLGQAHKFALENNLTLENADLEIQEAKKKVWETTAIGLPQVNGSFNFQHFMDIQVMPFPSFTNPGQYDFIQAGLENTMNFGLSASQLLFDGTFFVGLKAAKSYVEMTENQKKQTEIDIKENVSSAYFMVLSAKEQVKIMEDNIASVEKLYQETKALYKEGMVEVLSVDQLELNLKNMKASLDMAKNGERSARMLLNFHLGLKPSDVVELAEDLETLVTNLDEAAGSAIFTAGTHIQYQTLETKKKLDLLNLRKEQARALPSIALFYSNTQNKYGNEIDFSDNLGNGEWFPTQLVGVKAEMPLWSSMQGHARKQQARINLEQTKNNMEILENSLKMQADIAKSDYLNAIANYVNAKSSVSLADDIYQKNELKFKEGLLSSIELSQMKNQQLASQRTYVEAVLNVFNKKIALDKAYNKY